MNKLTLGLLLLTSLLAGCASMSEQDCLGADWQQIGERDGAFGHSVERLSYHEKACHKYGLDSDRSAYFRGHREGLRVFCTPESGYQEGIEQRRYRYVCPVDSESSFLHEYAKGLSDRVRELDYQYRDVQRRYQRARHVAYKSKDDKKRERARYRAQQYAQQLRTIEDRRYELNNWIRSALDSL